MATTHYNSKIIICKNVRLDKQYRHVLNYTENNYLTLCNSTGIKVAESNKFSFVRHGQNSIKTSFTYSDCLKCNYMAFQNVDYNNKWFFAFIDSVEFVSDGSTLINYTIDIWATWFNSLTLNKCFVVREHVRNDTLGLHTIPENLETGEYKTASVYKDTYNNDLTVVLGTTEDYLDSYKMKVNCYNGIPSPLTYYRYDIGTGGSMATLEGVLQGLASDMKTDSIVTMFLCPKWLAPFQGSTVKVQNSVLPASYSIGVERISSIDGYTPKNKKLLCWPYCFIGLSNGCGQYNTYHQEDWSLYENNMIVKMYGTLVNGGSIKVVPVNYLGNAEAWDEGITIGKFPSLAWPNDLYTNWLTQNGVNVLGLELNTNEMSALTSTAMIAGGLLTGNALVLGGGVAGAIGAMQADYEHSRIPAGVKGSINSGDVQTSVAENRLHIYKVTIKSEYAQIIDKFFSKYGYKITEVKTPDITSRTYWNFIQIGESEVIGHGEIPADALETINTICRNGTTVWHNHSNIGNYDLNNTIVS